MADSNDLPVLGWEFKEYKGTSVFELCEIEAIENLKVREDDVYVASFPRSGTTLTQEIVYLLKTNDFDKAKSAQLDDRFPYLDLNDDRFPYYRGVKYIEDLPGPRMIKTHLNYFLLPKDVQNGKGKLVFLTRNPKDGCLSWFKLSKHLGVLPPEHTFNDFFEMFMAGKNLVCGAWWDFVKEYWDHRDDKNVLFLKYEDIIRDKEAAIRTLADFLGTETSEDQVKRIAEHCSLENMKKNPMVNFTYQEKYRRVDRSLPGHINRGMVGAWKECYTEEMSRRIDEMLEREFKGTGLTFD